MISRKILLVPLGVFMALCLLEATMWIGSFARAFALHRGENAPDKSSRTFRILCLGESTTEPHFENSRDRSWPRQLEEILNAGAATRRYEVINKGGEGGNTTMMVSLLPSYLDEYRPDLIVTMMGINDDQWYGIVEFRRDWLGLAERELWRFKTVKLFRYIEHELILSRARETERSGRGQGLARWNEDAGHMTAAERQCLEVDQRDMTAADFRIWEAACRRSIQRHPRDLRLYVALGQGYRLFPMSEAGYRVWAEYVDAGGPEFKPYVKLIYAYARERKYAEVERVYNKAAAVLPRNSMMPVFVAMAQFYISQGREAEAGRMYRRAMEALGYDVSVDIKSIGSSSAGPKTSVTARNYRTMRKILEERRIPWVVMQYPTLDVGKLREIFDDAAGVLFVGNKENFQRALAQGSYSDYFRDRFAGTWGHCASRGDRLIADHLARELRDHGILK